MAYPTTDSVQDILILDLISSMPSNSLFGICEEATSMLREKIKIEQEEA